MKFFLTLVPVVIIVSCSPQAANDTANDSTSVADSMQLALVEASQPEVHPSDTTLLDSLKNDALSNFTSEYKLNSSSAAEQARMTLQYVGNRTFEVNIDWQIADFCSDQQAATFQVDEKNQFADSLFGRYITFRLSPGTVEISDSTLPLDVGICSFGGTFVSCHGNCEPISWEGMEEGEDDN